MKTDYKRTFIICDNHKFEVNSCCLMTEKEFRLNFENLPNFNWRNAYQQIKLKDIELMNEKTTQISTEGADA